MEDSTAVDFIALSVDIVSAYVTNNSVAMSDLPDLIGQVHSALKRTTCSMQEASTEVLKPAAPIRKSVMPDYIICLEDGKKFKSLKRHLRAQYAMSPEEYREKWALPSDYPMVAPNYAQIRSELAKQLGLGQLRQKAASARAAKTGDK